MGPRAGPTPEPTTFLKRDGLNPILPDLWVRHSCRTGCAGGPCFASTHPTKTNYLIRRTVRPVYTNPRDESFSLLKEE